MLRKLSVRNEDGLGNGVAQSARTSGPPGAGRQENSRYFKVVYRGGVGVRPSPTEKAPDEGQSFNFGDVIEVAGLAVAVPDGVVVEVKQPQGGWVYQRLRDQTILEEVQALKVEEGDWWYRVAHPLGAQFIKAPSLQPKAPRHLKTVPHDTIVHACRRHTPPGSSVSFVELSDNQGWIIESAADRALLERAGDGKVVMEHVTGEFRHESEAWYRVTADPGVELLGEPHAEASVLLEMFLAGKVFCACERFQPPGGLSAYVKVKGRDAWLMLSDEGGESCERLPDPMDEAIEQWYRVEHAGGVRLRTSPAQDQTDPTLGVLVCGWVFLAIRRVRLPGSSDIFLQVATPEGVVQDVSEVNSDYSLHNGHGNTHGNGDLAAAPNGYAARSAFGRDCGWVPSTKDGVQVVSETEEPWIERGLFPYQVVVGDPLQAKTGPHENAQHVALVLPPYSVAAVATFLETGKADEGFVQLAGTGSWVRARQAQDVKMVRLPAFPEVDKTCRRFRVVAEDGVQTVVGPSCLAPGTGTVLPMGAEANSEMVWSIEGWPADRGGGDTAFALLEDVGWVQVAGVADSADAGIIEVEGPDPPDSVSSAVSTRADGEEYSDD